MADPEFKVVLLGEGSVGKSSIYRRFNRQDFDASHPSTLNASFIKRSINLPNGRRVQLSLWDTAGQERFHALTPIYYREANGAVLVYDITDVNSFLRVKNWVKELKKVRGSNVCLSIAGNKMDLEKSRTVSQEEAESYAKEVGAIHFSTSAKLNKGINELFVNLSERMLESEEEVKDSPQSTKTSKTSIIIDDVDDSQKPKSSCC